MKLSNLRIGQQLAIAFGVILLLMVLLNITGGVMVSQNKARLRADIDQLNIQREVVSEFKTALLRQVLALQAVRTPDTADVSDPARLREQMRRFDDTRNRLAGLALGGPEAKSAKAIVLATRRADSMVQRSGEVDGGAVAGGISVPVRELEALNEAILRNVETLEQQLGVRMRTSLDAASAADDRVSKILSMISVFTLAVVVIVALRITRGIVKPLQSAMGLADRVAKGDLSCDIESAGRNEIGSLTNTLKQMNDNLARIVSRVRSGTESFFVAAREIAEGNSDLSARTETQAAALEEAVASMEELVVSVRSNAENARSATDLANSACTVAKAGGAAMDQVVETMQSIMESAKKIVEINSVIDSIAFQTNVLALNASVEAARAGTQGRGFAVVAAEVRALAQRSAEAAKEINQLISDSVSRVERGAHLVDRAGSTMRDTVRSVEAVAGLIGNIADASHEQSDGIQALSRTVATLDEITQQNAALVEEAAAAAEGLRHEAEGLSRAVSVFSLPARQAASVPALTSRAQVI
jgi:methyl-accepting chemotaxis protein